jgi:hypothetical protein
MLVVVFLPHLDNLGNRVIEILTLEKQVFNKLLLMNSKMNLILEESSFRMQLLVK